MLGYQFKAHPLASGVSLRESLCKLVKLLRSPAFAGRRSFVVVKGMEEWVEGVFLRILMRVRLVDLFLQLTGNHTHAAVLVEGSESPPFAPTHEKIA